MGSRELKQRYSPPCLLHEGDSKELETIQSHEAPFDMKVMGLLLT